MGTFGRTAVGGNDNNIAVDFYNASLFTLGSGQSIARIYARVKNHTAGQAGKIKCGIFSDSGGSVNALLGTTQESAAVGDAYASVQCDFAAPVVLGAGDYWLAVLNGVKDVDIDYAIVAKQVAWYPDDYADGFDVPLSANYASNMELCVYAEWDEGGGQQLFTLINEEGY